MLSQPSLFIQRIIDIIHSEDVKAFVDLFTPNAELILPNAFCIGRDAIRTAMTGMYQTYDNISIQLELVMMQGNIAFVQWRWRDRKRLTGQINETDTALVLELDGILIKRWREYHAPVLK